MDERAISFGSFRLLPSQRLLLEGGQPVRLGSRAFDILAALVERAGRVVPREELIARVWPKVFVEESNLKIQVSALRRALGDGQGGNRYIVTVPGRGYEFVVPVNLTAEPAAMPAPAVSQPGTHNLPFAVTRMIGREEAVAVIVPRVARAPADNRRAWWHRQDHGRPRRRRRMIAGYEHGRGWSIWRRSATAPGAEHSCKRARAGNPCRGSLPRPGRRS
jgi:DNA-binding winged helix-turn-helix (wHTH) protein